MLIILSVAGLAFKQTSDSVVLFVVTTEAVLSYNTSAKDKRVSVDKASTSCTLLLSIIKKYTRTTMLSFWICEMLNNNINNNLFKNIEFNTTIINS